MIALPLNRHGQRDTPRRNDRSPCGKRRSSIPRGLHGAAVWAKLWAGPSRKWFALFALFAVFAPAQGFVSRDPGEGWGITSAIGSSNRIRRTVRRNRYGVRVYDDTNRAESPWATFGPKCRVDDRGCPVASIGFDSTTGWWSVRYYAGPEAGRVKKTLCKHPFPWTRARPPRRPPEVAEALAAPFLEAERR